MRNGAGRSQGWGARASRMAALVMAFAWLLAAVARPADATTVLAQSLDDTVRQADAIVVGTVVSHASRWADASQRFMWTDYTLVVEDVVYPSERGVPIAGRITLTYWGGTIGKERQSVSDLRTPQDGEHVVVVLHSRWNLGGTDAPTVGFNQGYFTAATDASGQSVVRDADGQALGFGVNGRMLRGGAAAGANAGVDLPGFAAWLRANVSAIKATAPRSSPAVDPNDPRVLRTFAKTPVMPGMSQPLVTAATVGGFEPAVGPAPESGAGVPTPPTEKYALATMLSSPEPVRPNRFDVRPKWSTAHQAHPPIVVNSFPTSFAPWYPEDQYQMSKWNYYAAGLFHVYTTPSGHYGWPDGIFDLAGWPSDADRQAVYGSNWYCGSNCTTLGITFIRDDGNGWIIEADILLNPAVSWTLDDEWVLDGTSAKGFRQTMIHEMGHMHGLEHNFGFLALMNYMQPNNYRYYGLPYADDVEGVRFEYPSLAVSLTDLGVYLYYETGSCFDGTNFFTCIAEASFPGTVSAGSSFTVNNYHVENVGTATIGTPTIEWYLTSQRNYTPPYYYLGTTTYPSLSPTFYFTPSTVGRSLPVPSNVAAGAYYLAAFVRNDSGAGQGGFPFSNNYAFSKSKLNVIGTTSTSLTSSLNPSHYGMTVAFTATVTGSSPTGSVTFKDGGSTIGGCGAVGLSASKATCAISTLGVGTHGITATYNGNASNSASTSSTLSEVVNKAGSATSLASSLNPSSYHGAVTFTATVTGMTPGGTVSFADNGVVIGGCSAQAVLSGHATCTTSALAVGAHPIVATYGGDAFNLGSASSTVTQTVNKAASSTALSSSANPAPFGVSVTLTATITGGLPTGSVVFKDNGAVLSGCGAVALTAGTASCVASGLTVGMHPMVATYGGDAGNVGSTSATLSQVVSPPSIVRSQRDYNGDGKGDVVWRSASGGTALWLMNGLSTLSSAVVVADPLWSVTATGDFNGDGKTDVVWRHATTGQTAVWLMNGTATLSSAVVLGDPNWSVVAVADVDGNGKKDLVWRNASTGATAIWLMNGLATASSAVVMSDPNWIVTATGDFNGDGKQDLVWRNTVTGQTAIWLMDGLAPIGSAVVLSDPNWSVVAVGDFDGNGKSDLVWRNASTGQTAIWLMNGLSIASSGVILADPNWSVAFAADTDGNGKSDLGWRNTATGQTEVWLMNGLTPAGSAILPTTSDWTVVSTVDANGDGRVDLLWRSTATGQHLLWLMNGLTYSTFGTVLSDPAWQVQNPRGGP